MARNPFADTGVKKEDPTNMGKIFQREYEKFDGILPKNKRKKSDSSMEL